MDQTGGKSEFDGCCEVEHVVPMRHARVHGHVPLLSTVRENGSVLSSAAVHERVV